MGTWNSGGLAEKTMYSKLKCHYNRAHPVRRLDAEHISLFLFSYFYDNQFYLVKYTTRIIR